MQLKKIPATVVTGFLGSGKTTLLSNVLRQVSGGKDPKRIAVIVNEFGELDIDADLLRNCPLDCDDDGETPSSTQQGIYELANGCICCTVEEEFLPVMLELVNRRDDIDHILIETSGLALPKPLVQAFNWPEIKKYFTVDSVITVIDGPAVAAGRFAHDAEQVQAQRLADESLNHDPDLAELLDDQLSAADLVIVSKSDLLSDEERSRVEKVVTAKVPASVKMAYIGQKADGTSDASIELVMGLEAAAEDRIEAVHTHHDHHHDHGGHHEHAHDHFDSCVIHLGEVDGDRLQVALQELLSNHRIYRAKGFAALPNKPMRQVIQAVGQRLESHFDRLWTADEARRTSLVMIGKHLHVAELTSALKVAEV